MSDLTVGTAFLQITPSFDGFADSINTQATKVGESAGKLFADAFDEAIAGVGDSIGPSDADSARSGDSAGTSFADAFKARVTAALADLPDAKIGADATEADATIDDIRARLEALSNQRLGIDISDADALAAIDEIKADLDDLSAKSASVNVSTSGVDSAIVELEALKAEADELGSKNPTIRVNVDGAGEATTELKEVEDSSGGASGGLAALAANAGSSAGEVGALGPALLLLGAALVPIAGLAGGALAALPALLAGAGTGVGVLALGFSGITGAISDYDSQQNKAAASTATTAKAAATAANQAISNAETQRNAANSVQSAQEALTNASVNGDRQIQQAQEALGNAQVSAANSVHSAQEQLVSSEQSLTEAEYSEQQAQESLTQARIDATNALINYNDQLADGALNAQQDQINLQQAQAALAAGPTAGSGPGAQAQLVLNVQKAQQAIQDQGDQYAQLQQQAAAANAAGVEGSTQVVNAQHQVDQATQGVATAQQSVADNTTALAQAQASAVQKVSDAQNAVAVAQQSAAQSTADASRALNQALADQSDSLQKIATSAGDDPGGAGASVNQFAADMAKLSPAGQQFVDYFTGTVLPQFDTFKDAIQQALVPGFLTGLQDLQPLFTALQPLFIDTASGIGQFVAQLGQFLGSATGTKEVFAIFQAGLGFFKTISPAVLNLFEALTGGASKTGPILQAMAKVVSDMLNDFAKWVSGGGFEKFLDWLKTNGPSLLTTIENTAKAVGSLITDFGPGGKQLLDWVGGFTKLFDAIQKGNPLFGRLLADIGIGIALGLLLAPVISDVGLVAGAVILLVLGITELITHWRDVWQGIRDVTNDVWHAIDNDVFHPIEDFFTITVPHALSVASGAFTDGFQSIHNIVNTIWHSIDNDVLHPMENFFTQTIPNALQTMSNFFTNIWNDIWNTVKQYADDVQNAVLTALGWIELGWDATWGAIKDGFSGIWDGIKKDATTGIQDVIDILNKIIKGVDFVLNLIPGVPDIPPIPNLDGSTPSFGLAGLSQAETAFQTTHSGGMVGPGGTMTSGPLAADERLIKVQLGEEVLTADDPRHAANFGGTFHEGGIVGVLDDVGSFISGLGGDALNAVGSAVALTAVPAIKAGETAVTAASGPFGGLGRMLVVLTDYLGNAVTGFLGNIGNAVTAKQSANTAKGGGGVIVPNGPATGDLLTMFQDILQGIGAPINGTTIQDLTAWQQQEGGWFGDPDLYNPFNTTLPAGGSHGTNSVGVQSYPTFAAGLAATVSTINQGNMTAIRQALQSSAPLGAFESAVNSSPWGTVFHNGGLVAGSPDQDVLAVLQGGESVLTAPQRAAVLSLGNASNSKSVVINVAGNMDRDTADYLVSELERQLFAHEPV